MLEILVKSNSKKDSIVLEDGIYHVYTKEPAREGKANDSVISLLSKYLNIPKANIVIRRGKSSKKKFVEIA